MRRANAAFTLIELVVTVAVVAIVATVAVPSFVDMVRDHRLIAQTNELVSSLAYARSEATRRRADVGLCASADGNSCSGGAAWEGGWIVFDTTDSSVLRTWNGASNGMTVRTSNGAGTVTYNSRGESSTNLSFVLCDERGASYARGVTVMASGSARAGLGGGTVSCP